MNESQASKAVFVMAAVLIAGMFLEIQHKKATKNELTPPGYVFKRLWIIGLLTLVLSITADFVPEVAGPLALLILVSVAVHDSKFFGMAIDSNVQKAGNK